MQQRIGRSRAPAHLWIVGGLATLLNGFGAYDYLMTRMENVEYVRGMMPGADPQAVFTWAESAPIWAQFGWGLGPWCGLAGSLLLLFLSRFAVHAFALSLLGMALSFGWQFGAAPPMPGVTDAAARTVPILIVLLGLFLLWYASAMRKRGVLR